MKQHDRYPDNIKLAVHRELAERLKQADAVIQDLAQIAARLGSPEHRAVQAARRAYKNFFTLRAGMEAIFCENFPWGPGRAADYYLTPPEKAYVPLYHQLDTAAPEAWRTRQRNRSHKEITP